MFLASSRFCAPAWAHGVFIFAWPEPGRICTESYFSKSSTVRNGEVQMRDSAGRVLAAGRSDERGNLCFPAPESAMDLLFVVQAGQGHRAEFLLPAAATAEAAPQAMGQGSAGPGPLPLSSIPELSASAPAHAPKPAMAVPESGEQGGESLPPLPPLPGALDQEMVRSLLQEELSRQLAPLYRALAEQRMENGPGLKDIIAGLGWIVGLAGLGAWYASRVKKG